MRPSIRNNTHTRRCEGDLADRQLVHRHGMYGYMCVALAHVYHNGIWHRVSRCTYPRCALLRDTVVGYCPCTGVDESVGARQHTE